MGPVKEDVVSVRRNVLPLALAACGIVALLTLSCGGGSPSSSTPPTTVAPQPTPTPVGGGDPYSHLSCPYGKGDVNASCGRGQPSLVNEVEIAMDVLIQQQPQIFDLSDESPAGSRAFRVKDREKYVAGIVGNLRAAGLCSELDPDDAAQQIVRLKNGSDYSVDVDTLTTSGYMKRGNGMYRQTCSPSAFPVDRAADAPPIGSGCGRPYPPPISRFNCKVHIKTNEYYTLDSTPLVGPNPEYCYSIGYEDGRTLCPVRVEGSPDRVACENWRVGKAKDTGRWGPTWTKADGSYCTGPASGCENHPDNQYSLNTFASGSYTVTAQNGANCVVTH
jgi:hypothetical protein